MARKFEKDILECDRLQKAGENNVKQAQEAIDKATKRHTEAVASVKEQVEKMAKLKVDKEAFLLAQGVKANSFDSFFEGDHWASLRKNATVGKKATELMKEFDELNKLALPTIDLAALETDSWNKPPTEIPDPDLDEEADEDMIADDLANDVAEAQAKAASAGETFGKAEVAVVMKAGRANAKAAGKFRLIGRGKNANKPGGFDPNDKPEN